MTAQQLITVANNWYTIYLRSDEQNMEAAEKAQEALDQLEKLGETVNYSPKTDEYGHHFRLGDYR